MKQQKIVIYLDRGKQIRMDTPTWLISGLLALPILAYSRSKKLLAQVVALVSGILFLGLGLVWIPSLYRLLVKKPVVLVNEKGITYDPPRAGPYSFGATLPWEEIAALYIGEMPLKKLWPKRTVIQRVLCILPKEDSETLYEAFNPIWYNLPHIILLSVLMIAFNTTFVIHDVLLPISVDELFARIQEQYKSQIQAYGIELREVYTPFS